MPYKDPTRRHEYMRNYQRKWHQDRKRAFFKDKRCVVCGATEDLELSGETIGLRKLTGGINPWSLSQPRFDALVAKHAVVRCHHHEAVHRNKQRRRK